MEHFGDQCPLRFELPGGKFERQLHQMLDARRVGRLDSRQIRCHIGQHQVCLDPLQLQSEALQN